MWLLKDTGLPASERQPLPALGVFIQPGFGEIEGGAGATTSQPTQLESDTYSTITILS